MAGKAPMSSNGTIPPAPAAIAKMTFFDARSTTVPSAGAANSGNERKVRLPPSAREEPVRVYTYQLIENANAMRPNTISALETRKNRTLLPTPTKFVIVKLVHYGTMRMPKLLGLWLVRKHCDHSLGFHRNRGFLVWGKAAKLCDVAWMSEIY